MRVGNDRNRDVGADILGFATPKRTLERATRLGVGDGEAAWRTRAVSADADQEYGGAAGVVALELNEFEGGKIGGR